MRKFVSVVAVLAMLFALAMPAFAASESYSVEVGTDTTLQVPDDVYAYGVPSEEVDAYLEYATGAGKDELEDAAKDAFGKDATIGDVFNIESTPGEKAKGGTITVVYDGDGVVAGVMYYNELSGEWDYAAATPNADGKTYSVTLKHFCAAALVITPKPVTSASSGTTSGSTGTKSPQTGFDASAYMMVTATLVLFAGFCFVKARKVTE